MATEQAIEQVRDRIARMRKDAEFHAEMDNDVLCAHYTSKADAIQRILDFLTATPDAVAALPGKWREAAEELVPDGSNKDRIPILHIGRAEKLCGCADELDAALKGEK